MIKGIHITFAGQRFTLLPDRAIWWPSEKTLIVADVHIGKAATFRARGVPVPSGITAKDLKRLSALIEKTNATRLLVLGDFVHAREAHQMRDDVFDWRQQHADTRMQVVLGNHDKRAGAWDALLRIEELDAPHVEHDIALTHDPDEPSDLPLIAGHIHPAVRLTDFDGSGVNVPCFVVEERRIVLPSFGTFTGGVKMPHAAGRKLYAAAAGKVVLAS